MVQKLRLKMRLWLVVFLAAAFAHQSTSHPFRKLAPQAACGYDACAAISPDKLNVHMVPHTHDDVGWLKTVDQYYYGSRTNIQQAGVQYIIDSVVRELVADPSRRFIYVETAFLNKWWKEQTEATQEVVRGLVDSGRLEIINGAWSMNDEAAVHYHSTIDQFTWGFRVLNETFGECGRPTVGWQIDPFGHSREHASIIARMGFDGVFFARLDYQDKRKRLNDQTAEMIWRGSPDNLGEASDIFTHALYNHYSPPAGFCFDVKCRDDPVVDDESIPDYNVPQRVNAFTNFVRRQASDYRSNNVILTMGEDFTYSDAHVWYKNMDKIIKYVNADADSNMNVFYSTPSCYLKAVNDEGLSWPEKTDDFFPYANDFQSYWVGYFSSKPTTKYFERMGNNFLQVTKQLATLAGSNDQDQSRITELREAMGVLQHHDAITGTMKDHVAQDYSRILNLAMGSSRIAAETAINKLLGGSPSVSTWNCLKLNVSECSASEVADNFVVTLYNPLSRPVAEYVRVPVTGVDYQVHHPDGSVLPSDLVAIPGNVLAVPGRVSQATQELVFRADALPPLGYQAFYVTQAAGAEERSPPAKDPVAGRAETIGNDRITVYFDDAGLMQNLTVDDITIDLGQRFEYYIGAPGLLQRASGAYVFRPQNRNTVDIPITSFTVIKSPLVEEVHQVFGDGWVSQVIRVYKEEDHVEFEWMVGPIPDDNEVGKEVITKFATNLVTDGEFFTDSNGRELLKRVRDERPTWDLTTTEPISSNYYPVVSKVLIRDEPQDLEVAVLVDRAQGGSSINNGEIELMIHRRLFHDDGYGVDEPLNEMQYGVGTVARGKHWLVAGHITGLGDSPSLAARQRQLQAGKILKPWTFVSPTNGLEQPDWATTYNAEFSGLTGTGLPGNVQILTLEPWTQNTLLLRLEHILEVNEDDELSLPVTIDLTTAFSHLTINSAVETTLGGNQPIEELNRLQWNSEVKRNQKPRENKAVDITAVTLNPMEIRTFVVDYTLS